LRRRIDRRGARLGLLRRPATVGYARNFGAWIANLTALEPYKPYVAGVTLALLGYGFWHVYFKPKPPCEDGSYCARPQSAWTAKAVLWRARSIHPGAHHRLVGTLVLLKIPMKKTVCIAMAVLAMAGGGVAYAVSGTAQDRPRLPRPLRSKPPCHENVTCAICPITAKKAMEGVAGAARRSRSISQPRPRAQRITRARRLRRLPLHHHRGISGTRNENTGNKRGHGSAGSTGLKMGQSC
jgi:hypothetical protein